MRTEPRKVDLVFNDSPVEVFAGFLKTSEQLVFIMWLGKIVGGSAGKFIAAMDGKSLMEIAEKSEFNMDKIGDAIAGLFDRMDDKSVLEKLNLLLSSVKANGQSMYVDHAFFDQNLPQLITVLKIALEVNFKSFLPASSEFIKRLGNLRQKLNDSQKAQPSTGSSGAP